MLCRVVLFLFVLILVSLPGKGQQPAVTAQKAAMAKLGFLIGSWSGDASVSGRGAEVKLKQTEDVQSKLGGLLLTIEGTGRGADGQVAFQAFATVSYDEATATYRFRAYNGGHYLDTALTVSPAGFAWSMPAGPGTITNTMQLNGDVWKETTQMIMPGQPPRTSVQMLLHKISSDTTAAEKTH